MPERTIKEHECKSCGYRWYPRTPERPRVCPKCKSARWDIGRRFPKRERPAEEAAALVSA